MTEWWISWLLTEVKVLILPNFFIYEVNTCESETFYFLMKSWSDFNSTSNIKKTVVNTHVRKTLTCPEVYIWGELKFASKENPVSFPPAFNHDQFHHLNISDVIAESDRAQPYSSLPQAAGETAVTVVMWAESKRTAGFLVQEGKDSGKLLGWEWWMPCLAVQAGVCGAWVHWEQRSALSASGIKLPLPPSWERCHPLPSLKPHS